MPVRFLCDASATALQHAREASGVTLAATCYLTSPPIIAAALALGLSAQGIIDRLCNASAIPLRRLCDSSATPPRLLCNTPAKPLRCPCARDCNSYPTDSSATPLGRLLCIRLQPASMACVQLQGCYSTRHIPSYDDQCALHALLGSSTEDRS